MTSITATTHIAVPAQKGSQFPRTPIQPLLDSANAPREELSPSTQLTIPTKATEYSKVESLSSLADTIDETRANLNLLLTTWKDWIGKEGEQTTAQEEEEEEEEDQDEEE